jgi:hypothetical protein
VKFEGCSGEQAVPGDGHPPGGERNGAADEAAA